MMLWTFTSYSRGQSMLLNELGSLKQLVLENSNPNPDLSTQDEVLDKVISKESSFFSGAINRRTMGSWGRTRAAQIDFYGVSATSIRTFGSLYTTYSLALRFKIPLSVIFGARLFTVSLGFQQSVLSTSTWSLLPHSMLSVGALVPEESPIMSACKRGDLSAVQQLFQSYQARPDDVTPENRTTMKASTSKPFRCAR